MTIEEVALSQPRSTPLSLSWCYTELGAWRSVGDDHRRGGRFGAGFWGSGLYI